MGKIETLLNEVKARRDRKGLHVRVTGIPGRDTPFDYYAKDEDQRDGFIRKNIKRGHSVEIIGE